MKRTNVAFHNDGQGLKDRQRENEDRTNIMYSFLKKSSLVSGLENPGCWIGNYLDKNEKRAEEEDNEPGVKSSVNEWEQLGGWRSFDCGNKELGLLKKEGRTVAVKWVAKRKNRHPSFWPGSIKDLKEITHLKRLDEAVSPGDQQVTHGEVKESEEALTKD